MAESLVEGEMFEHLQEEGDKASMQTVQEQLLTEDLLLTRAEALEFCFFEREKKLGRRIVDRVVSVPRGPEIAYISPTSSLIATQMRSGYNPNHFMSTGRSILAKSQLQNGGIGVHDEDHVERYVSDLNRFFKADYKPEDVPYHEKLGGFVISIFGHNRQLGIAWVNSTNYGSPNHGIPFMVTVYRNPAFYEAIEMQALENNGLPLPLWERAHQMSELRDLRVRDGVPATLSYIANTFGVDEAQVLKSYAFQRVPDEIKDIVITDRLAFSAAFALDKLAGLYAEETIVDLAKELAGKRAKVKQVEVEVEKRLKAVDLTPRILAMAEDGKLSLGQTKEIHRLKMAGGDNVLLDEFADRAVVEGLSERQLRGYISEVLERRAQGEVSIFGDGAFDVSAVATQFHAATFQNNLDLAEREIMARFAISRSTLEYGVIEKDIVEQKPARAKLEGVRDNLRQLAEVGELDEFGQAVYDEISALLELEDAVLTPEFEVKMQQRLDDIKDFMDSLKPQGSMF